MLELIKNLIRNTYNYIKSFYPHRDIKLYNHIELKYSEIKIDKQLLPKIQNLTLPELYTESYDFLMDKSIKDSYKQILFNPKELTKNERFVDPIISDQKLSSISKNFQNDFVSRFSLDENYPEKTLFREYERPDNCPYNNGSQVYKSLAEIQKEEKEKWDAPDIISSYYGMLCLSQVHNQEKLIIGEKPLPKLPTDILQTIDSHMNKSTKYLELSMITRAKEFTGYKR